MDEPEASGGGSHWYGSWSHASLLVALSVGFVVALIVGATAWEWAFAGAILVAVLAHPLRALLAVFRGGA